MLRRCGLLAVLALMFGTVGIAQAQFADLTAEDPWVLGFRDSGIGFDKNVAGTWLGSGSFSVDLGCDNTIDIPDVPFRDAHTFGLGGTHAVVNPANPNTNLGTWERMGRREVHGRDVSFAVDATPGGTVTTVAIVSFIVKFDGYYKVESSTFEARVYLPHQDPLDPAELPVACTTGQHDSLKKVTVK